MQFLHANNEDIDQCADAQTDLSLRWAHMSEGTFPQAETQMVKTQ